MRKALITGIAGQDGSYMAELLLQKGYEIHGVAKSTKPENLWRISQILPKVKLYEFELGTSEEAFAEIFKKINPDEVCHLASQVETRNLFDEESNTLRSNFLSTHHLLRVIKKWKADTKIVVAGSILMFGDGEFSKNESTSVSPKTLYGIAKAASYYLANMYRDQYKIFACTAVLSNHESPRKDPKFLVSKITSTAVKIKQGLEKELNLESLEVKRDWGFAGDYVEAMHLMLQNPKPENYIIATGLSHSVKDLLDITFGYLGLDWKKYVKVSDSFSSPKNAGFVGDISKIKKELGWSPKTKLDDLLKMMVDAEAKKL